MIINYKIFKLLFGIVILSVASLVIGVLDEKSSIAYGAHSFKYNKVRHVARHKVRKRIHIKKRKVIKPKRTFKIHKSRKSSHKIHKKIRRPKKVHASRVKKVRVKKTKIKKSRKLYIKPHKTVRSRKSNPTISHMRKARKATAKSMRNARKKTHSGMAKARRGIGIKHNPLVKRK